MQPRETSSSVICHKLHGNARASHFGSFQTQSLQFCLEAINTGLIVLHTGDPDSFLGYLESEGKNKKELKMLQAIN